MNRIWSVDYIFDTLALKDYSGTWESSEGSSALAAPWDLGGVALSHWDHASCWRNSGEA